MLQISSGKLFKHPIAHRNLLRGVLFSNLRFASSSSIQTAMGRLLPTSNIRNSMEVVYEFDELIEGNENGKSVLVSHTVEPYLVDFGAVVSFSMNGTCTADFDLTRRLTNGRRGLSTRNSSQLMVRRTFDEEIWLQPNDEAQLIRFSQKLMGLKRVDYLAAMRAIRTYVTGMHRMADDYELAYTLLVASIESLAQKHMGEMPTWDQIDGAKRAAMDNALEGASANVIASVQGVLLDHEHHSLARRFRDFAISNVRPAYFRTEALGVGNPVGRSDLPGALKNAYKARSQYVHNLLELPKLLTVENLTGDSTIVDRSTWLTLQGLSRLARHVIANHIESLPTVESEQYDYRLERSGIIQVSLDPRYWLASTGNFQARDGMGRLEGFLQQYSAFVEGRPGATFTDLRPLLAIVEPMFPQLSKEDRQPLLALYFLFNQIAPADSKMAGFMEVFQKYEECLLEMTPVSLIFQLVVNAAPIWSIDEQAAVLELYFQQRTHKRGIRLSRTLEAGMTLVLAERRRAAGDVDGAKRLASLAVENFPENSALRELELTMVDNPINWMEMLLPKSAKQTETESPKV